MKKNHALRQLRGNMTMQEVADAVGISKSAYCLIESGARQGRPDTIYKIAKFFGVSIEQVFFEKSTN